MINDLLCYYCQETGLNQGTPIVLIEILFLEIAGNYRVSYLLYLHHRYFNINLIYIIDIVLSVLFSSISVFRIALVKLKLNTILKRYVKI